MYDVKHTKALGKIPTTSSIGLIQLKIKTKTCLYSITNKLLEKLLTVASRFSIISVGDIRIIKHTKKLHASKIAPRDEETIIFRCHTVDGAEVCELVGLYLLSQLQHLDIYLGLHTDDALAAHGAKTPKYGENEEGNMQNI